MFAERTLPWLLLLLLVLLLLLLETRRRVIRLWSQRWSQRPYFLDGIKGSG